MANNQSVDLIRLKESLAINNAVILNGVILGLKDQFLSSKSRKPEIATAITKCINSQMRMFKDIPPSLEVQVYARILQAGNGGIDQVDLFKGAEDFDKMWDAVHSLKTEGLIHAQEGQLLPVSQ